MCPSSRAGSAIPSPRRSDFALRWAIRAAALGVLAVFGPHGVHAQQGHNLGPRSLYGAPAAPGDIPLVMRDALQSVTVGTRSISTAARIIGGMPAPAGLYPWIASIQIRGATSSRGHFCGGAFIAPAWVITAAHCVYKDAAGKIQVLSGANSLDEGGVVHHVDRIVVHEKWDPVEHNNDVALLHLDKPYAGRTIRPVTPDEAEKLAAPMSFAIVAGWGLTAEGGSVSDILRHVTVQIVSNTTCNGLASYSGAISDRMMCAGFAEGGKDSCQGDSGGPLVVPDAEGGYVQVGVVSFGEGCARPNKYGVYARLSMFQPWVAGVIEGRATEPMVSSFEPRPQRSVAAPPIAPPAAPDAPQRSARSMAEGGEPPAAIARERLMIGPRSLYGAPAQETERDEIPAVVRDAVEFSETGRRLLPIGPRIVGGSPARAGAFPWTASIQTRRSQAGQGHFCGGAFVAPTWVITAAHCVHKNVADRIKVVGGTNVLDQGGGEFLVNRIVVHPQWDPVEQNNDVALLELDRRFNGRTIRIISPSEAERLAAPGVSAIAAGWGLTSEGGRVSNLLRQVALRIVSNATCNGDGAYRGAITGQMLCAGFAEGGRDSCQGDSGGPLMVPDGQGGYVQAGVVSFGEGCARPNKYGVYARLSEFQPWIASTIMSSGQAFASAIAPKPPAMPRAPAAQPATARMPVVLPRPATARAFVPHGWGWRAVMPSAGGSPGGRSR